MQPFVTDSIKMVLFCNFECIGKYFILSLLHLILECEECDGFENGHTCSDSGDCHENTCLCDEMFSGHSCQLGRKL